jgi:hypothetical protein
MRKTFIALAASAALLASIGLPKAQMAPARAGEGDCAFHTFKRGRNDDTSLYRKGRVPVME